MAWVFYYSRSPSWLWWKSIRRREREGQRSQTLLFTTSCTSPLVLSKHTNLQRRRKHVAGTVPVAAPHPFRHFNSQLPVWMAYPVVSQNLPSGPFSRLIQDTPRLRWSRQYCDRGEIPRSICESHPDLDIILVAVTSKEENSSTRLEYDLTPVSHA
jgi:hypothetical protein